ncbi:MAG: hypothetical protein RLZZ306_530 [Bacteroidota bacterium]|jgi:biopolymer transport protein ExbD
MKTSYKLIIGFLLLFILSVTFYFAQKVYYIRETLTKPLSQSLTLPDGSDKTPLPLKDIITVFPIGDLKIYFEAKDEKGILKIDSKEFNSLIKNQEKLIGKAKFTVVIKATEKAQYKDMVDLLDKFQIIGTKRYAIYEITKDETKRIESYLNNYPN